MSIIFRTRIILTLLMFTLLSGILSQAQEESIELDPACSGKDSPFSPYQESLDVYCDDVFMYIEAQSLADHDMMIGITAWNQQVPLPQHFEEDNAWRIPLFPEIADEQTPTTGQGPNAVAINGVMIFNPTQQSGIYDENHDPLLIGELDVCGGHSGRADDYHYHIAPNCILEELIEIGDMTQPIAYALDGFPIYGYENADDSPLELDECGGEFDADGNYHYHAQHQYPYINACFTGIVDFELQPATHPIRAAGEPIIVLITDYYEDEDGTIHLEYEFEGQLLSIIYHEMDEGCYEFQYSDTGQIEEYCGNIGQGTNPPPNDNDDRPPPPTPGN